MLPNDRPNFYRTLFWPRNIRTHGLIYGWLNDDGSACAVGFLADVSLDKAKLLLEERSKLLPDDLLPACGPLRVLGICYANATDIKGKQATQDDWLEVKLVHGVPLCKEATVVIYNHPDPRKLRFLAVKPLKTDITTYKEAQTDAKPARRQDRLSDLAREAISSDFTRQHVPSLDLDKVMLQINSTVEVQGCISAASAAKPSKGTGKSRGRGKNSSNVVERALLVVVAVLSKRPFGKNALKDISATAHQIDVRLQQVLSGPSQFRASYARDRVQPARGRAHYISFYGTLWLIANDIIIGFALFTFLTDNADFLAERSAALLKLYVIKRLQESVLWLNDWPGGLKLNYELGKFFSDAFLWFAAGWEEAILDGLLVQSLPAILRLIGFSAMFGTTMALSVMSDLLALATFHLYAFYTMATAAFRFHTQAMRSLFHIFRGKKYNVLRHRVEPSEYNLDQLLVGSVLFTLAAFLFPTVLAYYLLFASSRLCIILIHASLEGILAFLNHFPLFSLMLRLKDPDRLPGGLAFSTMHTGSLPVLQVTNNPISLSVIFHQYWSLWSSFSQHYSPFYLLGKILSGRYINAIPRSRLIFLENTTPGTTASRK